MAWLAWAVPAVVTLVIGLQGISVPMLWRDELSTWSASSRSLGQIWAMAHNIDAVLSVYYAGMHLWMSVFGDSVTALRIPSVLAMAGTAAVVAIIGRRFAASAAGAGANGGPAAGEGGAIMTGLVAGLLYAVIPSVSRYAQEARPYAFASLFAALATLALLRAIEHPRWHRWAWYGLALVGAAASNLITLALVAGHLVIVAGVWWRGPREPRAPRALLAGFGGAVVGALIVLAPLVIAGHQQSNSQLGKKPIPTFLELTGIRGGLWAELFSSAHVAYAILLLAIISVALGPRRVASWNVLACGVVPIVAVWVISHSPQQYWVFRYMLFTVPTWAVSAGLGVREIVRLLPRAPGRLADPLGRPRFGYAAAAIVVAVIGLLGLSDQRALRTVEAHNVWAYPLTPPNGMPIDYLGVVNVIAARQRPGDAIAYQVSAWNGYEIDRAVAYYMRGKPVPRPVFQTKTAVQANSLQPVDTADPAGALAGKPRLWVVFVHRLPGKFYTEPYAALTPKQAAAARAAGYTIQEMDKKAGITVALLTARR